MPEDWLKQSLAEIDGAIAAAHEALDALHDVVAGMQERRRSGIDNAAAIEEALSTGATATRRRTSAAFREVERSVMRLRARLVRELVNEQGLTLTGAAKRLSVSRQMAARLYQSGHEG